MKIIKIIIPALFLFVLIGTLYVYKPDLFSSLPIIATSENVKTETSDSRAPNKEEVDDSELQEVNTIPVVLENQAEGLNKEEVDDSELQEVNTIPVVLENQAEDNLDNVIGVTNKNITNVIVFNKSLLIYGGSFLIIILVTLLIVTFLLFREVRWRKRESKNPESVIFPNAHLDTLENLTKWFKELGDNVLLFGKSSLAFQKGNELSAKETIESISQFNSLIDEQKKEIDRLKEGYDFSIKKHSIQALLETKILIDRLLEEAESEETKEKLNKVEAYLQSYLEELDAEAFNFEVGESIRELPSDEFIISEVVSTTDKNLHEKIAEIINQGYVYIHPAGKNILKKVKLKVYKKEE